MILTDKKFYGNQRSLSCDVNDLKVLFSKCKAKALTILKVFLPEAFKKDPSEAFYNCGDSCDKFDNICTFKLDKHAPKKKKIG